MDISREDFKKLYEEKEKNFGLPAFEELDHEFEIHDFFISRNIPTTYLLRNTRRFIVDKLWSVINFLHNFIFPNQQSLILMEEAKKFSEEEKKEIADLMTKFTILARKGPLLELNFDEKADAQYISEIYKIWNQLKPEVKSIVDKNLQKWGSETKEEVPHYYG